MDARNDHRAFGITACAILDFRHTVSAIDARG
jgi:hypothetical protein